MTAAAHAGDETARLAGAASPAIVQTSTFVFDTFEAFQEALSDYESSFVYTRGNNPTVRATEEKIAAMEGAESCRLFGSGMAAISSAILSQVRMGDHIISIESVYGPAYRFLSEYLPRFGVHTTFVEGTDPAHFEAAIQPNTKLIYLESPSSMLFKLQDLPAIAQLARPRGIRTAIDNAYSTMMLQKPLDMGIDLSIYTATKYLNGHSDVVCGAVLGSRELVGQVSAWEHQLLGGIIAPFEAWLLGRGLRTLPARLRQHRESAAEVVDFLAGHPRVRRMLYPSHPSHPQYELASRQMKGSSSLFSIELDTENLDQIKRFANAVHYFGLGVSWGGFESLMVLPAAFAGRPGAPAGHPPGLARLYVGLEDPADLIADLDQALRSM